MTTILATLLQLTTALLLSAQNPNVPADLRTQAFALASQAFQLYQSAGQVQVTQVPVSLRHSPWLNAQELVNAEYFDQAGNKFRLMDGNYTSAYSSAEFQQQYISFGDLNHDNLDDAVVILRESLAAQPARYILAAVLNMDNGMTLNAANLDLGREIQIFDHRVQEGKFKIDTQTDGQPRQTRQYELRNGKLVLVNQI